MSIQHPPPRYVAHKVVRDRAPADYVVDGVEDNIEIQSALDSLTSGRTSLEIVKLLGTFKVEDTLKLPSYTLLDLQGAKLVFPEWTTKNLIENDDRSGGNTHIEIIGGIINGSRTSENKYPSTKTGIGVLLEKVTHGHVRGTRFYDLVSAGLSFESCTRTKMKGCYIENGYYGVWANLSEYIQIKTSDMKTIRDIGIALADTGSLEGGLIEGNTIRATYHEGMCVSAKNWRLLNNHIKELTGAPDGRAGILLYGTIEGDSTDNILIGNMVKGYDLGVLEEHIDVYVADYNLILGNNLRGNTTPISTEGANTIADHNIV